MNKKSQPSLVQVIAFKSPGPKWHAVGDPVERSQAVMIVAGEWKSHHLARIVPAKTIQSAKAS